jgi:hypothetical protein
VLSAWIITLLSLILQQTIGRNSDWDCRIGRQAFNLRTETDGQDKTNGALFTLSKVEQSPQKRRN